MHIRIYLGIHKYIYIHICVYTFLYIYIYIYIYTYIYVFIYLYLNLIYVCIHTSIFPQIYICTTALEDLGKGKVEDFEGVVCAADFHSCQRADGQRKLDDLLPRRPNDCTAPDLRDYTRHHTHDKLARHCDGQRVREEWWLCWCRCLSRGRSTGRNP